MKLRIVLPLVALLVGISACAPTGIDLRQVETRPLEALAMLPVPPESVLAVADSAALRPHIAELASDAYEGRGTGTRGEQRTIEYISNQFRQIGLEPGAPNGTFFQEVPLLGSRPRDVGNLRLASGEEQMDLAFVDQFIASTDLDTESVSISNAQLVFVGYGISNPGYDWDDYGDIDVTGKIIVSFVNDPPATPQEPNLFEADTLTYNGRWTYKYEEARRRGALGALLIHTNEMAGYPFTVLSASAPGEQMQLASPSENPLTVKGWVTEPVARDLARMSGTTLEAWLEEATSRNFQAREIPVTASLDMGFDVRRLNGTNVIARIPGTDRANEAIVYTAHHDHLGINHEMIARGEDGIYNGAVDNAAGVSKVIEAARAFASAAERPRRSVYFGTFTAEESGLLGSSYFAQNPPVPTARIIANINLDGPNMFGRTHDIVGIGAERSDMLMLLRWAAAGERMRVTPDNQPNQGLFFRSDQLAFAREGVPAVFIVTGADFVGRSTAWADSVRADWRQNRYHQPGDIFEGTEPFGGLVQQARVAIRMGWALAYSDMRPEWRPSEAFAQTRREHERAAGL